MATSPLFGWEEPDDTDLVKDGAAAIRTLGNAIDTSMGDLLGGTTGQVLSKASNANMDFTWVTSDDANAIQNAIVDAKGDIITATAADTPARLAVGANDLLLTAASGEATGLKYTGGWTTWTPSTNITVGNGTITARYQQIGKTVNFFWKLVAGSTTSLGGDPYFTLPIAASYPTQVFYGEFYNGTFYDYRALLAGNSNAYLYVIATTSNYGTLTAATNSIPAAIANGVIYTITGTYEVA